MASHGSDTPTSPRAVLHHTDAILCTFMHTTVRMKHCYNRGTKPNPNLYVLGTLFDANALVSNKLDWNKPKKLVSSSFSLFKSI